VVSAESLAHIDHTAPISTENITSQP
jgi:hypothetical protein